MGAPIEHIERFMLQTSIYMQLTGKYGTELTVSDIQEIQNQLALDSHMIDELINES